MTTTKIAVSLPAGLVEQAHRAVAEGRASSVSAYVARALEEQTKLDDLASLLIGFERNDRRVVAIVVRALEHHDPLLVPAGVVARAWRDGSRQPRLARLLGSPSCEVLSLDDRLARAAGQICGVTATTDVIDASVVAAARDRSARVLTSDPDDLRRLDARLEVVAV
jgi:hypothetical protein